MRIVKLTSPTRCEICHQSDLFDQQTGTCSRCRELAEVAIKGSSNYLLKRELATAQVFERYQKLESKSWLKNIKLASVVKSLIIFFSLIVSGLMLNSRIPTISLAVFIFFGLLSATLYFLLSQNIAKSLA